jgi:hypothetical protein
MIIEMYSEESASSFERASTCTAELRISMSFQKCTIHERETMRAAKDVRFELRVH